MIWTVTVIEESRHRSFPLRLTGTGSSPSAALLDLWRELDDEQKQLDKLRAQAPRPVTQDDAA